LFVVELPLMSPAEKHTHGLLVLPDRDALSRAAADEFTRRADAAVVAKGSFAVALSGGSTPKRLYELLASEGEPCRARMPWGRTHFFFGDERHVPPEHAESNYRMVRETLLTRAPIPPENVHRVVAENPDAYAAADEYERELRDFFHTREGLQPRFDLILLGLGEDGHTASLFPGTAALFEAERLFVANWVEKLCAYRLTMTLPLINRARAVVFLVSGGEKAEVLRAVLDTEACERDEPPYPAQLVHPTCGELLWLADEAAARPLRRTRGRLT
jgi:6-phosphogluconolactonase